MAKLLYIDACGGVSGDMLAGALLDIGFPLENLQSLISVMELRDVTVSEVRAEHGGIAARRLAVGQPEEQPHRHLHHVLDILAKLPTEIGEPAGRVFHRLAHAEAKVHGTSPDHVHFHEVGAVDAIVDVVAFCAGLRWLGLPRVICSPLPLGRGTVKCAHGIIPLPAPAVVELLAGVPVEPWPGREETVTPTGAALVSTLASGFGDMPPMRMEACGTGCGSRVSLHGPNLVRVIAGQDSPELGSDRVVELQCNIDDQSPEDLPVIYEALMGAGALDVASSPLLMKKGRPGLMLTVICRPEKAEVLAGVVLEQTTSLGLRMRSVGRRLLRREVVIVDSPWGPARIKRTPVAGQWRLHPEADDVTRISRETGLAPHLVRSHLVGLAKRAED